MKINIPLPLLQLNLKNPPAKAITIIIRLKYDFIKLFDILPIQIKIIDKQPHIM